MIRCIVLNLQLGLYESVVGGRYDRPLDHSQTQQTLPYESLFQFVLMPDPLHLVDFMEIPAYCMKNPAHALQVCVE